MDDKLKYAIAAIVAFILLIVGYIVYSQISLSNAQAESDRELQLQRDQVRALQAMQELSNSSKPKSEHFESNITDTFVSNLPEGYTDNIQF
jgi:hypothetical protein